MNIPHALYYGGPDATSKFIFDFRTFRFFIFRSLIFRSSIFRSSIFRSSIFRSSIFRSLIFRSLIFRSLIFRSLIFYFSVSDFWNEGKRGGGGDMGYGPGAGSVKKIPSV